MEEGNKNKSKPQGRRQTGSTGRRGRGRPWADAGRHGQGWELVVSSIRSSRQTDDAVDDDDPDLIDDGSCL